MIAILYIPVVCIKQAAFFKVIIAGYLRLSSLRSASALDT